MDNTHIQKIADELKLKQTQVAATVELLDDDATVPFIARYRKEATGSLDEVQITTIRDRIGQLRELDKRREAILKSLTERELLTEELEEKINAAETMAELEDIYLPYKPKRRTRATIAREKGLEPLAELMFAQTDDTDPEKEAKAYIDEEKGVPDEQAALAGARDIIAEWVAEDADSRAKMRELYLSTAIITSVVTDKEHENAYKYEDYYEWDEPLFESASHRLLAMRRGESEGILRLAIEVPQDEAIDILKRSFIDGDNACADQVQLAIEDSFKRLLAPSMETEMRTESKKAADIEAIRVFAANLRELLMASPLGRKDIIAIDPGFRTGCKVVALDSQGKLLENTAIFPFGSDKQKYEAEAEIKALVGKYKPRVIAIGNGTASRETEAFISQLDLPSISVEMVNEAGASVYSASEVAREEFPDYDVTVRGAVSIGRRLMDPLAELVKIEPKAIGVGQYQHDVDQLMLKQGLDDTVISCVNSVGVELNTASKQLLTYVSGLGPSLAQNIVDHRNKTGPFKNREAIKKVSRLGPKAFEQAAGFLRINDSSNPLDKSAVHPESYHIVEKMAKDLGCQVSDLMSDAKLRRKIHLDNYVTDKVGLPTLEDIIAELDKPGRDPRAEYVPFKFDDTVHEIEDLKPGMILPGIVTNVTNFGAFVDVGVHQDGLVHISELANRFVKTPTDIVKVHQRVRVKVMNVEVERRRIALSMKEAE